MNKYVLMLILAISSAFSTANLEEARAASAAKKYTEAFSLYEKNRRTR
jgi:hypothetical protein